MPVIKYRENAGEPWTKLFGIVGPEGPAGPVGPLPEKGVDYFTEEDIRLIAQAALDLVASGEEIYY